MLLRYQILEILSGSTTEEALNDTLKAVSAYTNAQSRKLRQEKEKAIRLKVKLTEATKKEALPRAISNYDIHIKGVLNSIRRHNKCGIFYDPHFCRFAVRASNLDEHTELELVGVYTKPYNNDDIREDMQYVLKTRT